MFPGFVPLLLHTLANRHFFFQCRMHIPNLILVSLQAPLPLPPAWGKCSMPVPEKFDDSRDQLPVFLAQTHLFIELLSGQAAKWATPLVLQTSPLLNDLKGFLKAMQDTWGDPNSGAVPALLCELSAE
uniref:DUF4939 domain-containing protein n=1 Tax=Salvator merianae TaxID=96440 RepID=A0A8D0BEX4_SALMN